MRLTRRRLLGSIAATAALPGCTGRSPGGEADGTPTTAAPPDTMATTGTDTATPASTAEPVPTVRVASHPDLGEILVGPDGLTLYLFEQDTRGAGESTCYDSCADTWPPLTVDGTPTAGEGVTATLGTFERETGGRQVTVGGWPVYYFRSDTEPGDANGQGVNDVWYAIAPDGTRASGGTPTASATPPAAGGGY